MSITIEVKTKIPDGNNPPIENTFNVVVPNELLLTVVELEYVPASQGGPLMRPKNPPR